MPDAETTTTTAAATTASPSKKVVHWQEVQDTVSRLASHKGVLAISILNSDGDIVTQQTTPAGMERRSVGENSSGTTTNVLGNPKLLALMMKNANAYVESLSGHENDTSTAAATEEEEEEGSPPTKKEDISFLRIRTQKDEILVAPKLGYTLVVLQDPALSSL